MEYKVLSGPFNAGKLERDLNGHAADGWRVAGTSARLQCSRGNAMGGRYAVPGRRGSGRRCW